jgi:hypothetical protein
MALSGQSAIANQCLLSGAMPTSRKAPQMNASKALLLKYHAKTLICADNHRRLK